ncbi:hypothetical protein BST61_g4211 [Cercospora zeina]
MNSYYEPGQGGENSCFISETFKLAKVSRKDVLDVHNREFWALKIMGSTVFSELVVTSTAIVDRESELILESEIDAEMLSAVARTVLKAYWTAYKLLLVPIFDPHHVALVSNKQVLQLFHSECLMPAAVALLEPSAPLRNPP